MRQRSLMRDLHREYPEHVYSGLFENSKVGEDYCRILNHPRQFPLTVKGETRGAGWSAGNGDNSSARRQRKFRFSFS